MQGSDIKESPFKSYWIFLNAPYQLFFLGDPQLFSKKERKLVPYVAYVSNTYPTPPRLGNSESPSGYPVSPCGQIFRAKWIQNTNKHGG